jgi:hypothetical protein
MGSYNSSAAMVAGERPLPLPLALGEKVVPGKHLPYTSACLRHALRKGWVDTRTVLMGWMVRSAQGNVIKAALAEGMAAADALECEP